MEFCTPQRRSTVPHYSEAGEGKLDSEDEVSIVYKSFGFFKFFKLDGSIDVVPLSSQYVKIGRRPDMDIVLGNRFVSRHHLNFVNNDGGSYLIQCVASTNSSYLNDVVLSRGKFYSVKPSVDVINVMGLRFVFFEKIEQQQFILSSPRDIPKKTGLFIDDRVCFHFHPGDSSHPENPDRIRSIKLLFDKHPKLLNRCRIFSDRRATKDELLLCHDRDYIEKVLSHKIPNTMSTNDVYTNENTPLAATLAVGGVIEIVEKVIQGELENGFAIVRPPGHHADRNTPNGFCIFNNVAVAARVASNKYHKKVVIVDCEDNNVLFFSIHRYDENFFYPGTGESDDIGEGKGKGYNINIPVGFGYNNHDMLHLFFRLVLPVCLEFSPDLIIISAGFDAAVGDPLGECVLTPEIYGVLTALVRSVTRRIVLALEGGYNLEQSAKCCLECLKVLVGEDTPKWSLFSTRNGNNNHRNTGLEGIVNEVSRNIHPFWNSIIEPALQIRQINGDNSLVPKPPINQQQQKEVEVGVFPIPSEGRKGKKKKPRLSIFSNRNQPTPLKPDLSSNNKNYNTDTVITSKLRKRKRRESSVDYTTTTTTTTRLFDAEEDDNNPRKKKKRKLSSNNGNKFVGGDKSLGTGQPRRRKMKKKRDSTFVPKISVVKKMANHPRRGRRIRKNGRK